MKKLLIAFLVLVGFSASAKTVVIGSGSGSVSQTSMTGLVAGDILQIKPGTYSSGDFENLNGVAILPGGTVTFTGTVTLSALTNVTFEGSNNVVFSGGGFYLGNPSSGLRIYDLAMNNSGLPFNVSTKVTTYTGSAFTKRLLNCSIAGITLNNCGQMLQGSYAGTNTFQDVIDSLAVFNITINTTSGTGEQIGGNSIYRLCAHDWTVTGGAPNGKNDVGLIDIAGNGSVYNIYRNGGWGYILRIWNVGLNGVSESYLYNCIDIGSSCYGTVDTRVDSTMFAGGTTVPYCTGGNMHVLNNTSGNKADAINYTSVLVIVGDFAPYKLEVRNNLCFNNKANQSNPIFTINTGNKLTDTSNNLYYTSSQIPSVLADQVNCFLIQGSPAIDKGYTEPVVTTDIEGIPRPQGAAYDIGAREYASAITVVTPPDSVYVSASNQSITLPVSSATLSATANSTQGTISSYAWTEISGPSNATLGSPTAATTTVSGVTVGSYLFGLKVTDSKGVSATTQVSITVSIAAQRQAVSIDCSAGNGCTIKYNDGSVQTL